MIVEQPQPAHRPDCPAVVRSGITVIVGQPCPGCEWHQERAGDLEAYIAFQNMAHGWSWWQRQQGYGLG